MKNFIIFLSGKCKGLSKEEQNKWRYYIREQLEQNNDSKCKVTVINPNEYFNYFENLHKTNKQIKRYFISMIDKSDLIIVNLNNSDSSVGTGQELQHAVDKNIPIIGFGTENIYEWESENDCDVVFETIEECVKYVRDYYINIYN